LLFRVPHPSFSGVGLLSFRSAGILPALCLCLFLGTGFDPYLARHKVTPSLQPSPKKSKIALS